MKVRNLRSLYLNDKLKGREEFAKEFGSDIILPMDVAEDQNITDCFAQLASTLGKNLTVSFTQLVLHQQTN